MSNDRWTRMLNELGVGSGAYPDRMQEFLNKAKDSKGLPDNWEFIEGPDGVELWYAGTHISTQGKDGSWFRAEVRTGVGSFHLGDAHTMSSCGQNVGFLNEFGNANEGDKIFWFPLWQGLSKNGNVRKDPTALSWSAYANYEVNGAVNPARTDIPYNFSTTITTNMAVTKVQIMSGENYSGNLSNIIISNGAEIYRTELNTTCLNGQPVTFEYKYPFFTRAGDVLTLQLVKEDGTYLKTWAGATDANIPYRKLYGRQFSDMSLLPAIDGSRPDSGVTIVDADKFLHNDNGDMKQTSFTRLWAWIVSKVTGTASTILTTDLTADRVMVTNSSKKAATSATTSTELGYLSGATSNIQGQLNAALRSRQNIGLQSLGNSTADQSWATVVSYEGLQVQARWNDSTCARIKNDTGQQVTVLWHRNGAIASSNESIANGGELTFPSPSNGSAEKYEFTAWRGTDILWHGTLMMYKFTSGVRVICDLAVTQP